MEQGNRNILLANFRTRVPTIPLFLRSKKCKITEVHTGFNKSLYFSPWWQRILQLLYYEMLAKNPFVISAILPKNLEIPDHLERVVIVSWQILFVILIMFDSLRTQKDTCFSRSWRSPASPIRTEIMDSVSAEKTRNGFFKFHLQLSGP